MTSSIAARDYLIIAEDFNARVEPKDQATSKVLGNFGLGQRFENGERLVNYALMNQLTTSNSLLFSRINQATYQLGNPSMALPKPKLTTYSSTNDGKALFKIHVLIREQILDRNLGQIINRSLQKFSFCSNWKNLSLTDLDYANDVGLLSDPEHAQKILDDIVELSTLIGLKVMAEKN
ncbi:hypothetical protein QYM36_002820 [Artemia franciscana]|uniref:Uncharacterized protein n=1 Tax=Artemia franciscana TaxID=6661 RepID=A0AA88I8Q6_ARTSF|nr:hypothetical protein QYM36_002820 [Artemia franciscana]